MRAKITARPARRRRKAYLALTTLSLWARRKESPSFRDPPRGGLLVVIPVGNRRIRRCLLRAAHDYAGRGKEVTIRYATGTREPSANPSQ